MVSSVTVARIVERLLNIYQTVTIKINKTIIYFNTLKQILQLKYLQSNTR